jgi:hypothetical protein
LFGEPKMPLHAGIARNTLVDGPAKSAATHTDTQHELVFAQGAHAVYIWYDRVRPAVTPIPATHDQQVFPLPVGLASL